MWQYSKLEGVRDELRRLAKSAYGDFGGDMNTFATVVSHYPIRPRVKAELAVIHPSDTRMNCYVAIGEAYFDDDESEPRYAVRQMYFAGGTYPLKSDDIVRTKPVPLEHASPEGLFTEMERLRKKYVASPIYRKLLEEKMERDRQELETMLEALE